MGYLKRNKIGTFWPIPRKGTKYLALANHNQTESIPLVVVLRNMLKLVKNKKELKRLLNEKQILVNQSVVHETNYPICLFDVLTAGKQNYRAIISENKKMSLKEISDKEAQTKTYKVMGKKKLAKGKIQLNLMQGKNILSEDKVDTGDSVILHLKDNKIVSKISLEKGKNVFALKGKHMGHTGKVLDILVRGGKNIAKIESNGEKINVWVKNLILVE